MTAVRKTGGDALLTDFKLAYAEKGVSIEAMPASKKVSIRAASGLVALQLLEVIAGVWSLAFARSPALDVAPVGRRPNDCCLQPPPPLGGHECTDSVAHTCGPQLWLAQHTLRPDARASSPSPPAVLQATVKYTHAVVDGLKLSAETSAPEPNKDIKARPAPLQAPLPPAGCLRAQRLALTRQSASSESELSPLLVLELTTVTPWHG